MGKTHEEGVFQLINPQGMLGGVLLDNKRTGTCAKIWKLVYESEWSLLEDDR